MPDDPDLGPDALGTGGCLRVVIEKDEGELQWVHFFGLSHNPFVEMSKTTRKSPWQLGYGCQGQRQSLPYRVTFQQLRPTEASYPGCYPVSCWMQAQSSGLKRT